MSRARELTRKVFTRKYSLTLSVEALEWLLELVRYFEIPDDEVESTMGTIAGHIVAEEGERRHSASSSGFQADHSLTDVQGLVPLSLVEATYQKIRAATSDSKDDGNGGGATMAGDNDEAGANAWDVASYLRFVNARDMPRSFWNEQTKMLETCVRSRACSLSCRSTDVARRAHLQDKRKADGAGRAVSQVCVPSRPVQHHQAGRLAQRPLQPTCLLWKRGAELHEGALVVTAILSCGWRCEDRS